MENAYIREYTELPRQELRQLSFKRRFKTENPNWDDSMIKLRDLVAKTVPLGGIVLDVGCGHGNFIIDELSDHFSEKIGLDMNADVAAHNTSVERVLYGNADNIPLPDASTDITLSLWVVEHLKNPQRALKEMVRVTKTGGHIAFVTPNANALIVRLRTLIPYRQAKKLVRKLYGRAENDTFPIEYRANTIRAIQKLARENELEIVYLAENADPSYTSFESVSYRISAFLSKLPFSWFKPHLIVILKRHNS